MVDNVCSGKVGAERGVLHRASRLDFDETMLGWPINDQFPSHGRKVLIRGNETQQTDSLDEKSVEAHLIDMSITNVGVRSSLDCPEVLPLVILPQLADESRLDLLSETFED